MPKSRKLKIVKEHRLEAWYLIDKADKSDKAEKMPCVLIEANTLMPKENRKESG